MSKSLTGINCEIKTSKILLGSQAGNILLRIILKYNKKTQAIKRAI